MLKIKNLVKLEIIIQVNMALLQTIYVNQNIAYLKNFLYFFTIDLTMTIIKQLTEENIEKYITFNRSCKDKKLQGLVKMETEL